MADDRPPRTRAVAHLPAYTKLSEDQLRTIRKLEQPLESRQAYLAWYHDVQTAALGLLTRKEALLLSSEVVVPFLIEGELEHVVPGRPDVGEEASVVVRYRVQSLLLRVFRRSLARFSAKAREQEWAKTTWVEVPTVGADLDALARETPDTAGRGKPADVVGGEPDE